MPAVRPSASRRRARSGSDSATWSGSGGPTRRPCCWCPCAAARPVQRDGRGVLLAARPVAAFSQGKREALAGWRHAAAKRRHAQAMRSAGAGRIATAMTPPPLLSKWREKRGIAARRTGMSRVAVVIVNFNAGTLLADGIAHVREARGSESWDVIIVDNASTDGSLDAAARFARRPGDSERREHGLRRRLQSGRACWRRAVDAVPQSRLRAGPGRSRAPHRGSRRPTRVRGDRASHRGPRRRDAGQCQRRPDLLAGVAGRTGLLTRVLPSSGVVARQVIWPDRLPPGQSSMEVDWLSGACLLVRRSAFEAIGGFDPGYFMYWEDADLCRRLRERGGAFGTHRVSRAACGRAVEPAGAGAGPARVPRERVSLLHAMECAPALGSATRDRERLLTLRLSIKLARAR